MVFQNTKNNAMLFSLFSFFLINNNSEYPFSIIIIVKDRGIEDMSNFNPKENTNKLSCLPCTSISISICILCHLADTQR